MANFFPLYLDTGSVRQMTSSQEITPPYLPTKPGPIANTYVTTLPDPYYYQIQAQNVFNSSNATSSSILEFAAPVVNETAYYILDALLLLFTTATATGVRIGLQSTNNADSMYTGKVASTLTAFTILNKGTGDAFAFVQPGSMASTAAYPGQTKGFLRNTTTDGAFRNVLLLQSETANQVASVATGFMNVGFVGFSSSVAPISSSYGSLALSSSRIETIGGGDLVTQSVLPPTTSLWMSQSLSSAVSTTSATVYQNVFTLTGLADGEEYYVQFYLIARTAATTTGFRCRAIEGGGYCGSIYIPTAATATSIRNSSDGGDITNAAPTAWPAANSDRLVYGEYKFFKVPGSADPMIDIISEIAGSAVTAGIGSVVFYRKLQKSSANKTFATPLTTYSGSMTAHSIPGGATKGNILRALTNQFPTFNPSPIQYILQPESAAVFTTSTTPVNVTNLQITLQNSSNYLIIAYMGGSSAASTVGFRSGVTTANATVTVYSIEIPSSATAITIGNNTAAIPTASPASNIANYYMIKTITVVRTAAAGTPTWTPTIYSETGGQVSMGPSVVYYIKY